MENTTPLPPLIATVPVQIGPLDNYWLTELVISLPVVNGEATATISLLPYQQTGETVTAPLPPVRFVVENLFSVASTNPDLEVAIRAISTAILQWGIANGLFQPIAQD